VIRLLLKALIALSAAVAVYIAMARLQSERQTAFFDLEKTTDAVNTAISLEGKSSGSTKVSIGGLSGYEILAGSASFHKHMEQWLQENTLATLNWALLIEDRKLKSSTFEVLLPVWIMQDPTECGEWIIENQDISELEIGIDLAVELRASTSPYHAIKIALQLTEREFRRAALLNIFRIWAKTAPAQATSYLEDLKSLPEFEEILLEVSLVWGDTNIFQAADWLMQSKFDEDRVILSLVVRRAAVRKPKDCLKWIFTSIAPEEREEMIEDAVFSAIGSHKNALADFARRLVGRKADMLNGVIAVALAEVNDESYKVFLDKITNKNLKLVYLERSLLAQSKLNPKNCISSLSLDEWISLSVKREMLINWTKVNPEEVYEWLLSDTPTEILEAVLMDSLPDPLSEFKKNKLLKDELIEIFPKHLLAIVPLSWRSDSPRYLLGAKIYQSFRSDLVEVAKLCASGWASKELDKALKAFDSNGSAFNDYFYLGLISELELDDQKNIFTLPKRIKNPVLQRQAIHYLFVAFVESQPMRVVKLISAYDLMNFSTASHLMSTWSQKDIEAAEKWLLAQVNETWFSSTAAVHGANLASQSPQKLKNFIRRIPQSEYENFQDNLESHLAQTNPELLKLIHSQIQNN
jgi:hypothetical protein